MTENTATVVEAPAPVEIPGHLEPLFQMYKDAADAANSLSREIQAATSGQKEAIDLVLNESEDPTLVEFRQKRETAAAKLKKFQDDVAAMEEAARVHASSLVPAAISPEDLAAKTVEFQAKRKIATDNRKGLILLGSEEIVKAGVEKFNITEVKGISRNSEVSGPESRKPRLAEATINGEKFADEKDKVSFTTLATKLNTNSADLRAAAFKAAGTDDLKSKAGEEISFSFVSGKNTYDLVVTPV